MIFLRAEELGIENARPFFTRGVLFDVQGLKDRVLDVGEEIKLADLKACLKHQGVAEEVIRPGDAAFVRTGNGSRWYTETSTFYDGAPGIGLECARWLSTPRSFTPVTTISSWRTAFISRKALRSKGRVRRGCSPTSLRPPDRRRDGFARKPIAVL